MTTTKRTHTALSTLMALAIALGVASTSASAAPGDLGLANCLSHVAATGCTDPTPGVTPLGIPGGIAASPVGTSVYATTYAGVAHLERDAGGSLHFIDCVANGGAQGCANPSPGLNPLDGARGVAVSPGGDSVYVVSENSQSISHFIRDANGSLTFAGCIADSGIAGCANPSPGHLPLNGARNVAVSPDGASVYVVSRAANSISHFIRAANGSLTFAGCIANGGSGGCTNPSPGQAPLSGPEYLAISPGPTPGDVYVSSFSSNSVSHFTRAANGSLTFAGCIANGGANGCTDPSSVALAGPAGIAVSPDGADVYLASVSASNVSRFSRAANGSLTFAECIGNGGANGCANISPDSPGNAPLGAPLGIALSPGGGELYIASNASNSVVRLLRAGDGSLSLGNCVSSTPTNGCSAASTAGAPLDNAEGVAASPDGAGVFATAAGSRALSGLTKELAPAATGTPASLQPPPPPPPHRKCKRKRHRRSATTSKSKKKCKRRRQR